MCDLVNLFRFEYCYTLRFDTSCVDGGSIWNSPLNHRQSHYAVCTRQCLKNNFMRFTCIILIFESDVIVSRLCAVNATRDGIVGNGMQERLVISFLTTCEFSFCSHTAATLEQNVHTASESCGMYLKQPIGMFHRWRGELVTGWGYYSRNRVRPCFHSAKLNANNKTFTKRRFVEDFSHDCMFQGFNMISVQVETDSRLPQRRFQGKVNNQEVLVYSKTLLLNNLQMF